MIHAIRREVVMLVRSEGLAMSTDKLSIGDMIRKPGGIGLCPRKTDILDMME